MNWTEVLKSGDTHDLMVYADWLEDYNLPTEDIRQLPALVEHVENMDKYQVWFMRFIDNAIHFYSTGTTYFDDFHSPAVHVLLTNNALLEWFCAATWTNVQFKSEKFIDVIFLP